MKTCSVSLTSSSSHWYCILIILLSPHAMATVIVPFHSIPSHLISSSSDTFTLAFSFPSNSPRLHLHPLFHEYQTKFQTIHSKTTKKNRTDIFALPILFLVQINIITIPPIQQSNIHPSHHLIIPHISPTTTTTTIIILIITTIQLHKPMTFAPSHPSHHSP